MQFWCAATIRTLNGSTHPVWAKKSPAQVAPLSRLLNSLPLSDDVAEAGLVSSDAFRELAANGGCGGLGGGTGFCLGLFKVGTG